jgi:hypothetical protein
LLLVVILSTLSGANNLVLGGSGNCEPHGTQGVLFLMDTNLLQIKFGPMAFLD